MIKAEWDSEPIWGVYEYTCENGAWIRFSIPITATKDDLLGFREMVDVVLKRRFKIEEEKK